MLFDRISFLSPCLFCLLTAGVEVVYFSLDHTQRHTTVGRAPLNEWSARHRDPSIWQHKHSQETNIHARGGIRTHDPSKPSAADLRLRPRGSWDRPIERVIGIYDITVSGLEVFTITIVLLAFIAWLILCRLDSPAFGICWSSIVNYVFRTASVGW
jgi:hypothetical protein